MSDDIKEPLTPEQEEWVMDLAEKHNLGRRVGQIGALRGVAPDVFYTDASYRTQELFDFAAELLATPATPAQAEREPASVTTAQTVDQIIADDQRRKQAEEFDWSGTDDPEPERVALTPQEIVLAGWSWRKYAQGTKEGRAFLYGALFAQEYHGIGTSATKEGV